MSSSRYARGLAAISVVALAAGLFVSSIGVSPLFAEEVSTNGSDANRVIESGTADDGDGTFAPNSSTVPSSEGRLKTRRHLPSNRPMVRRLKMLRALRT